MYSIKVLNDAEFNKLPYKGTRESLGLADPKKNTAYIRDTGAKYLNMVTIEHEIDELVAKVSPHEIDGIRYKKFRESAIAKIAVPVIAGLLTGGAGTALGLGGGMASGLGALAGAGAAGGMRGGKPKEWLPAALGGGLSGYGGSRLGQGFFGGAAAPAAGATTTAAARMPAATIPGGSVATTPGQALSAGATGIGAGAGAGAGSFWDLSKLFKGKTIVDFLPAMMSAGSMMGQAPSMPQMPNVQFPMASQPDIQSSLANYQELMQPTMDIQYQNFLKQLRPAAARGGYLDSTYYGNLLSEFQQAQNAALNAAIPGMMSSQYGTDVGFANTQYQTQLAQYLSELQQRNQLQQGFGSNLMGLLQ